MKKLQNLIPLIIIVLSSFHAYSQLWHVVGSPGFSAGTAYYTSMAVNSKSVPYIAYQDAANNYAVTVMKYNGTNWIAVGGAGFSTSGASNVSLSITSSDTAYVAFMNDSCGKASVMKFNGANWVYVGAPFFTDSANGISFALGANDTAYIAYLDALDSSKVTVLKYNGTNWVNVGMPDFSDSSDYVSLAIDKTSNIPYVAFTDAVNGDYATVASYISGKWNTVGLADFSADIATYLSLAVTKSGVPMLAYQDGGNNNMATVMQYTLGAWNNVGNAGFSAGAAYYTSLAVDSAGVPFVAYQDGANGSALTVMEYTGTVWAAVGQPACTIGTADFTSLAIDRHGRLYTGFMDGDQSGYASVVVYQHCNIGNPTVNASVSGKDTICPGTQPLLNATGAINYAWSDGDSTSSSKPVLTDTSASYTFYVTGIAANGCASSDSVKVYTRSKPSILISGKDTICSGSTTTLSASGGNSYKWSTGATSSSVSVSAVLDTAFYVVGTDKKGCADTVTQNITVNYGPAITITTMDSVCKGYTDTLSASGGVSYVWQPGNLSGDTIYINPLANSTYTVTATGSNGCTTIDSALVKVWVCDGVQQLAFSQQFNIYPNPATDDAYITSYGSAGKTSITVYNGSGQAVTEMKVEDLNSGEQVKLELNGLSIGLYYIKVIAQHGVAVYKLVKE